MSSSRSATLGVFGVVFPIVGLLACESKESDARASRVETRSAVSAAPNARTLSAAECEKESQRNAAGCDWYYDPMRLSAADGESR